MRMSRVFGKKTLNWKSNLWAGPLSILVIWVRELFFVLLYKNGDGNGDDKDYNSHSNTDSTSHTSSIKCVPARASALKCYEKRTLETETQIGQWEMLLQGEESVNRLAREGWEGDKWRRWRDKQLQALEHG